MFFIGVTMSRLIRVSEEDIERLEREYILKKANKAYANLKNDPEVLREFEEEMKLWDVTLSDGLDDE
jgi:hypothetical protein